MSPHQGLGPTERGLGEGLAEEVSKGLAKGWQRLGEGLAQGWRRVGEGLVKGLRFPCTLQFSEQLPCRSAEVNFLSVFSAKSGVKFGVKFW